MKQTHEILEGSATRRLIAFLWIVGLISVLLGLIALVFPLAASIGVELTFGILLVVVGVFEVARGVSMRGVANIAMNLLFGALALAAGLFLLFFPLGGILTLTVVLSWFFLLGGGLKIAAAFHLRPLNGWGWLAFSGVISVILGGLLLLGLPGTATWALGLLFGIDLVFLGAAQIAVAVGLNKLN